MRATRHLKLTTVEDTFKEGTTKYIEERKGAAKKMKVEVFPVNAAVRDNTATNWSEGSDPANDPGRRVPMHFGVIEFHNMHRERFFTNRAKAQAREGVLPLKVNTVAEQATPRGPRGSSRGRLKCPTRKIRPGKERS